MKLLITGATGLVGGELVRICREEAIPVNYLTTRREKIENTENYQGFYWNPDSGEIDPACFEGVTAIINLAGASVAKRWTKAHKEKILNSRIRSLKTLYAGLEEAKTAKIETLVSASAIGIYPGSLTEYYTEDTNAKEAGFLGQVVEQWEGEILEFEKLDIRPVVVRIGLVLSEQGGALPQMVKPVKNYVGAALGSGEQWQSWIHLEDLARLFLFLTEKKLNGIFNGVAPNPVTNKRLTREIAKVFERPLFLPNIPEFMMRLILGEMATILFSSHRVSCQKAEKHGFDFQFQNICSALQDLHKRWQ